MKQARMEDKKKLLLLTDSKALKNDSCPNDCCSGLCEATTPSAVLIDLPNIMHGRTPSMQSTHIDNYSAVTLARSIQSFGLGGADTADSSPTWHKASLRAANYLTVGLQANRHDDNSCDCAVMMMQRKS
jgi:hypothetical protein